MKVLKKVITVELDRDEVFEALSDYVASKGYKVENLELGFETKNGVTKATGAIVRVKSEDDEVLF